MQQVGDDEEFLRELLNDLRTEIDTQLGNIAAIIQVSVAVFVGICSCCCGSHAVLLVGCRDVMMLDRIIAYRMKVANLV